MAPSCPGCGYVLHATSPVHDSAPPPTNPFKDLPSYQRGLRSPISAGSPRTPGIPAWGWVLIGLGAFVLLGIVGRFSSTTAPSSEAPGQSSSVAAAPAASPDDLIAANRPPDETAFLQAVTSARDSFQAGANDMAKGAAKAQRKAGVCAALQGDLRANGWVGTVNELGANGDGKGILTIEIGSGIIVHTWNNFLSDSLDNTLIEPSSSLFGAASALAKGDPVRFSGEFFADDVDCARETSLGLEGSLTRPQYLMRFSSVSKLTPAPAAAAQ